MDKLSDFQPGDSVKINPAVYEYKWDGWEELWKKYRHHNGRVERIVDMSDVDGAESVVIVVFPSCSFNKAAIKPGYLWRVSGRY